MALGFITNLPKSSLENGYAGLVFVLIFELLASAAVVAATVNGLAKVRRHGHDLKADVETGRSSAGRFGERPAPGYTSDKNLHFLDMESYRRAVGSTSAAILVRGAPGTRGLLQKTISNWHFMLRTNSNGITRRHLLERARNYPRRTCHLFRVLWAKEVPMVTLPPLSPKKASQSAQCCNISIDLLTQCEVPLETAQEQPITLQPTWWEDPDKVPSVSTPMTSNTQPLHRERMWHSPNAPGPAQTILPATLKCSVIHEGSRDVSQTSGWVRPRACCGRARRMHVAAPQTAGVQFICDASGMHRQNTMDALLECTINDVLSF